MTKYTLLATSRNHFNLKLKLLGKVQDIICTDPRYFVLNFYQINDDSEIRTRDRLVIKALIPYQETILT